MRRALAVIAAVWVLDLARIYRQVKTGMGEWEAWKCEQACTREDPNGSRL